MKADLNRLKRRPFLVPLLMPVGLLGIVLVVALWLFDARSTSIVIVVRNAETEAGTTSNPGLSTVGQQHAKMLQQFLTQAKPGRGVDVVYVAQSAAAQQTATPLAESMGLAVNVVPAATWPELPRTIRRDHAGEVILVVAAQDEMKSLIAALSGTRPTLDEQDYAAAFVISQSRLSKSAMVKLRY